MNIDRSFLVKSLSKRVGYDVATPNGAEKLRNDIETATGEILSVNTIKRLTGVIPYPGQPRHSTLEIIARFLNFPGLKALEKASEGSTSEFSLPAAFIDASALPAGTDVLLEWAPDRIVIIRCLEGESYLVESSANSKLRAGDILAVRYLAEGYPLIVREVVRDGKSLGEYTAASEGGLSKVELISRDGE